MWWPERGIACRAASMALRSVSDGPDELLLLDPCDDEGGRPSDMLGIEGDG